MREKKKKAREQPGSGDHTLSSRVRVDLAFYLLLLYELQTIVNAPGFWELKTRTRRFDLSLLESR